MAGSPKFNHSGVFSWQICHVPAEPRMDENELGWARTLFYVGLTIVVLTRLLAFVIGSMTHSRLFSMLFGIMAAIAMALIGQLATARMAGGMGDAIAKMGVAPPGYPERP